MSKNKPKNVAASVRSRLLRRSKEKGEDFNYTLTKYGLERLLYRLSQSPHKEDFVLKGAMLFSRWADLPYRATRDIDLLSFGSPQLERLRDIFVNVCSLENIPDDGLVFSEPPKVERIKEDQEYEGVRLDIKAKLGNAKIKLQVDVGFGDAITPGSEDVALPTLLDFPAPTLRAYPKETVIAEKLQAMVDLGIGNTRLKDFFDVLFLCEHFSFDGTLLRDAVCTTFSRRKTELPTDKPVALTSEFAEDETKKRQWSAFLRKANVENEHRELPEVMETLKTFLFPLLEAAKSKEEWAMRWDANGSWEPIRSSEV